MRHVERERPAVKRKKELDISGSAFDLIFPAPRTGAALGQEFVLPVHDSGRVWALVDSHSFRGRSRGTKTNSIGYTTDD